jgi:hypothetical protein
MQLKNLSGPYGPWIRHGLHFEAGIQEKELDSMWHWLNVPFWPRHKLR